jgi:hypothetical protein
MSKQPTGPRPFTVSDIRPKYLRAHIIKKGTEIMRKVLIVEPMIATVILSNACLPFVLVWVSGDQLKRKNRSESR